MSSPPDAAPLTHCVRAMLGVGRTGRPTLADHALTFGSLAAMLATASLFKGHFDVPGPRLMAATVVGWLPLLARTYFPLPVLGATVLVASLHLALLTKIDVEALDFEPMGSYQPVPLATMVAAYTVAAHTSRRIGWTAGLAAATILLVVALARHGTPMLGTDMVMFNVVALATGAGVMVASRRDNHARRQRERDDERRQAVLDERLRIARELHDVLAHNLTLVNAQAAVADYLLRTDPDAAASALRDIARHTGRAIDELRATVGVLRDADASAADEALRPVPTLAQLDELLGSFRASGADIELVVTGTPLPLDEHRDLTAYRIVQEALTNANKHAPGATVTVHFGWTPDRLALRVTNTAPEPAADGPTTRAQGTGNGLIGMRERALATGGNLVARHLADGGFQIDAEIPTTPTTAATRGQR